MVKNKDFIHWSQKQTVTGDPASNYFNETSNRNFASNIKSNYWYETDRYNTKVTETTSTEFRKS